MDRLVRWQGGLGLKDSKRRLLDRIGKEIGDKRVIEAMRSIPREAFVPDSTKNKAYEDIPLPIGEDQTISQPYIVALMIDTLELRRTDKVLEIGTGSGYQTAILAELANWVTSVERIPSLAHSAQERLEVLGCTNVEVRLAEIELGWPVGAPYNAIIVAAGAPVLPRDLIEQLDIGGRLVIPVGSMQSQELMKVHRTADGFSVRTLGPCRFVPLVGKGAWPSKPRD